MSLQSINPIDLTKYIIHYVNKMGHEVNHLKLQKLLYFIEAWHLAIFETSVIQQDFEAWMHGPVVRQVWDYYKSNSVLYDSLPDPGSLDISKYLDKEQIELINDVLDEYGDKTAYYLECLTHVEDPWINARQGCGPNDRCEAKISKEHMKEYYRGKIYG